MRVIDIELEEVRASGRAAAQANANVSASSKRFTIEAASLQRIRAEMPTANDDWEVERLLQYRCLYGVEQWLVKWQGYGEDRNTWEPATNLLSSQVQAEAVRVREAALQPRTQAGLLKFVVVTLKAALEARSLDTTGQKAELAARLLAALNA